MDKSLRRLALLFICMCAILLLCGCGGYDAEGLLVGKWDAPSTSGDTITREFFEDGAVVETYSLYPGIQKQGRYIIDGENLTVYYSLQFDAEAGVFITSFQSETREYSFFVSESKLILVDLSVGYEYFYVWERD